MLFNICMSGSLERGSLLVIQQARAAEWKKN